MIKLDEDGAIAGLFDSERKDTSNEQAFQDWYSGISKDLGINPNPDDPKHYYDYRGYFNKYGPSSAEDMPVDEFDGKPHFTSEFKLPGHPTYALKFQGEDGAIEGLFDEGETISEGIQVDSDGAIKGLFDEGLPEDVQRNDAGIDFDIPQIVPQSQNLKEVPQEVKDYYGSIKDVKDLRNSPNAGDLRFQALLQGFLPISEKEDMPEELDKAFPISHAVGQLLGLAGVGKLTSPIAPAITQSSALIKNAGTVFRMTGARMAQSGVTFGLKEIVDSFAKQFSGTEERKAKEIAGDILKSTAFGVGIGAVGSIPKAVYRIPAEASYGFATAKLQGADNFEAGISAAVFGIFGMLNRKNLNESYRKASIAGMRKAIYERVLKQGFPEEVARVRAYKAASLLEDIALKRTGKPLTTKDADRIASEIMKGAKLELVPEPVKAQAKQSAKKPEPKTEPVAKKELPEDVKPKQEPVKMAPEKPKQARKYDVDKARQKGDKRTLIIDLGGFNYASIKDHIAEPGTAQWRKDMGKLRPYLRKNGKGIDETLQEAKGLYPDLFNEYSDIDLLDAILDGSINKGRNAGDLEVKFEQQEAEFYEQEQRKRQSAIEAGETPESLEGVQRSVQEEVRDELQAEGIEVQETESAIKEEEDLDTSFDFGENVKEPTEKQSLIPGTETPTYKKPEFGQPSELKQDQTVEPLELQKAANEAKQGHLFDEQDNVIANIVDDTETPKENVEKYKVINDSGTNIAIANEGISKNRLVKEILSNQKSIESENLSGNSLDELKSNAAKFIEEWKGKENPSPAFDGEIVHVDNTPLEYATSDRRTEEDKMRRLRLFPKAKAVLENAKVVDEVRKTEHGKRYSLVSKFSDGDVVRVIVDETVKDGKRFLSVFNIWKDKKEMAANSRRATGSTENIQQDAKNVNTGKIDDVGEKIGGARKDTSVSTGPKVKKVKSEDPGWRKRYEIAKIEKSMRPEQEGKWAISDKLKKDYLGQPRRIPKLFDSKEEAEAAIPLIAVSRNHNVFGDGEGKYQIYRRITDRKRVIVVDKKFDSRDDAMKYMAENAEQIIETNTSFGEEILPKPDNVVRTGEDFRKGKDVVAKDFMETFGLRAVEFGNWNNQEERQEVLNHAFDALYDMAGIIGIPAKAVGLNGELALAFGARGQGLVGAKAHYERSYGVINLTKMKGAGSLAHEWFHAADHYFGRQDTKASSERVKNSSGNMVYPAKTPERDYVSHGFSQKSQVRDVVKKAYDKLIDTMLRKGVKYVEDVKKTDKFVGEARTDVEKRLQKIRDHLSMQLDERYYKRKNKPATAEQLAEFDGIAKAIIDGEYLETSYMQSEAQKKRRSFSGRWSNEALEKLSAIYKAVRGRSGFYTDGGGPLDNLRGDMKRYDQRLKMLAEAQKGVEKEKFVPTDYAKEAKSIDQGRTSEYWTTPHEMAARAFHAYVGDKIAEIGNQSDFLVYGTNVVIPTPWGWKRPYPSGEERVAINKAFDELFRVIETEETAKGIKLKSPEVGYNAELDSAVKESYAKLGEEGERAYGSIEEYQKAIKEVFADKLASSGALRGTIRKKILSDIKNLGFFQTVGLQVKTPGDVADIVAVLRNNIVEKLSVIYVKKGVVVAHDVTTVNIPNAVYVKPGMANDIAKRADKLGADSVYMGHNHPTGNPTPSPEDVKISESVQEIIGDRYKGHVVTNHDKFVFIDRNSRPIQMRFAEQKTDFNYGIDTVASPAHGAYLVKEAFGPGKITIMFLDSSNKVIGMESFKDGGKLNETIMNKMRGHMASFYVLGVDETLAGKYFREEMYKSLPLGFTDVVAVGENSVRSAVLEKKYDRDWERITAHQPDPYAGRTENIKRVREANAPYSGNVFYSKLERIVSEKMPNKATAPSVAALLKSQGVKQEEIEWSGILEYIKGKEKVSKDEILDYLKDNQIEIKEVEKNDKESLAKLNESLKVHGMYARLEEDIGGMEGEKTLGIFYDDGRAVSPSEQANLPKSIQSKIESAFENMIDTGAPSETKFSSYTLPGGENYREVLLTLPSRTPDKIEDLSKAMAEPYDYKSPHWEEPNVLAHIRLNDRSIDGKKTLFIEEIQSDWHQKGREKGYRTGFATKEEKRFLELDGKLRDGRGALSEEALKEYDGLYDKLWEKYGLDSDASLSQHIQNNVHGLPNAPFKKSWHELALKRILRMAVDEGYDAIAWTTGEQQAERYDLSKQISEIRLIKVSGGAYLPKSGEFESGTLVAFNKSGVKVIEKYINDPKELSDVIGKEAAERILKQPEVESRSVGLGALVRSLKGENLKVGGEGMKGFYDKILPSFLNKYTKKWGGRVVESDIKTEKKITDVLSFEERKRYGNYINKLDSGKRLAEDENNDYRELRKKVYGKYGAKVHALEITPSMQDSLMQPQALFEKPAPYGEKITNEAEAKSTADEYIKQMDFFEGEVTAKSEKWKEVELEGLKDISGFKAGYRDVYRNLKEAFGEKYDAIDKKLLTPLDESRDAFIEMQIELLAELDKKIVKGLGIKKGSKESEAVQEYGEGTTTEEALVKKFGKEKAKRIVEADKWFREQYDRLISLVNRSIKSIYPNRPDKLVPHRKSYYRHFREFSQFSGLVNIFDTPSNIPSELAGVSQFTKPKSKFLGFAQRRLGMRSEVDAVGGFLDYVPSAAYATHISPMIKEFRSLAKHLREITEKDPKLNNLIEFLDDYANDLAGKTSSSIDRFFMKRVPGGRKTMMVLNWINNRVKANVILGNASSAIAQFANIPQGISKTKIYSFIGFGDSVSQVFKPSEEMAKSTFIKARYFDSAYDKFDVGMLKNVKNFTKWMIRVGDEIGTKFIWNSAFRQAEAKGHENPIKYADDLTRSLVAGRSVGEVPIEQKSKVFQLLAPFQLEVTNLWWALSDEVDEKDFSGLIVFALMALAFNEVAERVRGSRVIFDPIDAIRDAVKPDLSVEQRFGRIAAEILSNMPLGDRMAVLYPEYGFEIGGHKFPTRQEFYGRSTDPTRFGIGILALRGVQDPLFKLGLPFGGAQIKRSIKGIKAVKDGYMEVGGKVVRITQSSMNAVISSIFGPYATPEIREYLKLRDNPEVAEGEYRKVRLNAARAEKDSRKGMRIEIERQIKAGKKDREILRSMPRESYDQAERMLKEARKKKPETKLERSLDKATSNNQRLQILEAYSKEFDTWTSYRKSLQKLYRNKFISSGVFTEAQNRFRKKKAKAA